VIVTEDLHQLVRWFDEAGDAVEAPSGTLTLDEVKQFVKAHVVRLLDQNPGMLMSILYRIDVPESQVQDVLRRVGHDEIPDRLTDLIVERELQKVHLRRKYRDDDGV
jgi:hypothetical protein